MGMSPVDDPFEGEANKTHDDTILMREVWQVRSQTSRENVASRGRGYGALVLMMVLCLSPVVTAQGRTTSGSPLEKAMARGDYELASQLARSRDDAEALLVRAQMQLYQGDVEQSLSLSKLAEEKAVSDAEREEAAVLRARALYQQARWEEAVEKLEAFLRANPNAHMARLELGKILWTRGKEKEAYELLDYLGEVFNNGQVKTSRGIGHVAEAMQIIGNFQDANYAFTEAYKTDQQDADVLAKWGHLYLEKYNMNDALRNFDEALAINPNHVQALIGRISLSLMRRSETDNTNQLLDRLESVAPGLPDLHVLRGYLSLRDDDADTAKKHFERALSYAPEHLDALTFLGAHALYVRDAEAYARYKKEILRISPKDAEPLVTIADFVANTRMEHDEAIRLYKEALEVDRENATALMGIGFVLSRTNHDDEALDYFQRSFELDPYNMRVYFVLEVYDDVMPQYSFKEYERFKLRAKNSEFTIVDLFAAPVIEQAMKLYDAKYDFKPDPNLAIELYPDAQTFSIRSLGIPYIGAHGLCFGPLVTMHSPSEGNFNWHKVLWHEMAHVYHLQLSNSRVPRWFTEGLAEYETNVKDPSWRRYYDPDVATMLKNDAIPTVLDLSRGFTHSESNAEIVRAYHLASLAIHFIASEWGFDAIVQMLEAWGDGKESAQVVADVLKTTPGEFDAKFKKWLERYLIDYKTQIAFDFESIPSPKEVDRALKLNRRDVKALLHRVIHAARSGNEKEVDSALATALNVAPKDPEVHYVALFVRAGKGDHRKAYEHGNEVLDAFKDSYDLRLYMGRISLMLEEVEEARVHLEAATQLDPNGLLAWKELSDLGRRIGDKELYTSASARLYALVDSEPSLAVDRIAYAREQGDRAMIGAALKRWQDINPFDERLHREAIAHWSEAKSASEEANMELERAYLALIRLVPSQRAQLYKEAFTLFQARSMSKALERLEDQAEADGIVF